MKLSYEYITGTVNNMPNAYYLTLGGTAFLPDYMALNLKLKKDIYYDILNNCGAKRYFNTGHSCFDYCFKNEDEINTALVTLNLILSN